MGTRLQPRNESYWACQFITASVPLLLSIRPVVREIELHVRLEVAYRRAVPIGFSHGRSGYFSLIRAQRDDAENSGSSVTLAGQPLISNCHGKVDILLACFISLSLCRSGRRRWSSPWMTQQRITDGASRPGRGHRRETVATSVN